MAARLPRDFGEGLILGAITLLIVAAAAAEELRRPWRFFVLALNIMGDTGEALHRGLAVVKDIAERTGKHLFEPDREHAIGAAERDQLARENERGRSGRAIIVDVDDRNAGDRKGVVEGERVSVRGDVGGGGM